MIDGDVFEIVEEFVFNGTYFYLNIILCQLVCTSNNDTQFARTGLTSGCLRHEQRRFSGSYRELWSLKSSCIPLNTPENSWFSVVPIHLGQTIGLIHVRNLVLAFPTSYRSISIQSKSYARYFFYRLRWWSAFTDDFVKKYCQFRKIRSQSPKLVEFHYRSFEGLRRVFRGMLKSFRWISEVLEEM